MTPITETDRFNIRRLYREAHSTATDPDHYTEWLEEQLHSVQSSLDQVDDVLVVNWVGPRKDGDYKRALHDLVMSGIEQEKYFANQERHSEDIDSSDPFEYPAVQTCGYCNKEKSNSVGWCECL